ncbi:MAG TPA: hypothetical protein DCQ98_05050 [Planctomycetaceae bacterium]|nr:hypothetical protein [Planctomycetaceae bacterium]
MSASGASRAAGAGATDRTEDSSPRTDSSFDRSDRAETSPLIVNREQGRCQRVGRANDRFRSGDSQRRLGRIALPDRIDNR